MSLFDPDELNRVLATLARLAAVACVVLVVTGVPLMFAYDPDGSGWLSGLHSLASALLVGCAAGAVACGAGVAVKRARTWVGWPLALAGLVVAAGGTVSGQLVRWSSVRPDDADARGVFGPLGGAVEAVHVGGADVSQQTFLIWVLVHAVVVAVLVAVVGGLIRRRHGRWLAGDDPEVGAAAAPVPDGDVRADTGAEPPGG